MSVEFSLSLCFQSEHSSEIREILRPLFLGEERHRPPHLRFWIVRKEHCVIEKEIEKLVTRCEPFAEQFADWAAAGTHAEIFVGIFSEGSVCFSFPAELSTRISALQLHIGFDFYAGAGDC